MFIIAFVRRRAPLLCSPPTPPATAAHPPISTQVPIVRSSEPDVPWAARSSETFEGAPPGRLPGGRAALANRVAALPPPSHLKRQAATWHRHRTLGFLSS
eukprot:1189240-Prorocentrum_minimum.AAC.2